MAAFSRLQLAAALLEYDNDKPDAPHRSAHESAIFAPLRRTARPPVMPRRSDYLGVNVPSESGSVGGRESVLDGRKSRSSIGLRNMFSDDRMDGEEEEEEEEVEEEVPDVDLSSWGLDAYISKDKEIKNGKGKAKSVPASQPLSAVRSYFPQTEVNNGVGVIRRPKGGRSMSVGNYDFLIPSDNNRRRQSIASPLDLAGLEVPATFQRPSISSPGHDEPIPVGSIPFPTTSVRSPSPLEDDPYRRRVHSTASLDPKMMLSERPRVVSSATMETTQMLDDDNPFALRPPSRSSKFDPKSAAHARTISNASFGSRMLLDNDGASVMTTNRNNRYSTTMDLLRPKVLVMPSPLQPVGPVQPSAPKSRDGFQVSSDPPLPPGARSSHYAPIASNSFTPNPVNDLSLSQMTFRNHLMVDGRRDTTFDDGLPRALEEGQQVQLEFDEIPAGEEIPIITVDENMPPHRPAGKLYGKSLIDDLESRKAQLKGKQRVFTGDDRPSMMKRGTLIDPESLRRPPNQRSSSYGTNNSLERRNSANVKPLLNFDEGELSPANQRLPPAARSVFGVDTLWEREMRKLKQMEALEAEEREKREREEALREAGKGKKGKKGKHFDKTSEVETHSPTFPSRVDTPEQSNEAPIVTRSSTSPPVLPDIKPASNTRALSTVGIRGPPPVIDDNGSDSEESVGDVSRRPSAADEGWHSSEDEGPKRTTGVGLRHPVSKGRPQALRDDDSDEDVPLSMAVQRQRSGLRPKDDDSDEEKPLSMLLDKARLNLPEINFDKSSSHSGAKLSDDDDDDEPLGIRASRVMPSQEDDDVPLAYHPQQQVKSQYQMMQQHQMMMQNSMFFNPSMSGFFAPPPPIMMPPMMPAPVPMPSPPPVQDPAKLNRVDQWRHNVAIES